MVLDLRPHPTGESFLASQRIHVRNNKVTTASQLVQSYPGPQMGYLYQKIQKRS